MSPRGRRRLILALAAVVGLLFAGRWIVGTLADRWWGAQFSAGAAAFLTELHLLRLVLDAAAVLVSSSWFIGHLLVVYRAIGSVQVPRHVANLEFREALTPRVLLRGTVGAGALIGLAVGAGASRWWPTIVLAWHGAPYAVADPMFGHDFGLYVAQLPFWRLLHGFALLLVGIALVVVLALYIVIGAVRWLDRRPAISDHARAHLGWLLVGLALCLGWGYLLEPYELVAGIARAIDAGSVRTAFIVSPALTGVAIMVAILSAVWTVQPRHALILAGWAVLAVASLAGHYILPAIAASGDVPVDAFTRQRIESVAFGLDRLRDSASTLRTVPLRRPAPFSIWHASAVAALPLPDSSTVLAVNPAVVVISGHPRPAWLTLRAAPSGRIWASAIADDRTSPAGFPLYYRPGDTLPYPRSFSLLELSPRSVRPNAPEHLIDPDVGGVAVDTWFRRAVLAWALQASGLLRSLDPGARVAWHLEPQARLSRLAPFAEWSAPQARIVDGELVWLADGYVSSSTFPVVSRLLWRERSVNALEAGFLGVVHAEDGSAEVYLRPDPGALSTAWAELAEGVVQPASAIPSSIARMISYPAELFRVQAMALDRPPWDIGRLVGKPLPAEPHPFRHEIAWERDTSGTMLIAAYEEPEERRLRTIVTAGTAAGRETITLVRIDSTAMPSAPLLQTRQWERFPTFEQLQDSVRQSGARLERGPFRFWLAPGTIGAYQVHLGRRPSGETAVAWVSLAVGRRLGAGRGFEEAWENLQGTSAPAPPGGARPGLLEQARIWLRRADAALRAGDLAAFARAFDSLKRLLEQSPDSAGL